MFEYLAKAQRACEGKNNRTWAYGSPCYLDECAEEEYCYICRPDGALVKVYRDTVCRPLGMEDCNGEPLFEFDIVGAPHHNRDDAVIVYCEGVFCLWGLKERETRTTPLWCSPTAMRLLRRKCDIWGFNSGELVPVLAEQKFI